MKEFPNLAIMASAGTGKTYSLAMRYITLLKLGVKPEEIVAMTFTNKAAGEIFDKIIQEILKMIASPAQLRSVIDAGSLPENTTREELFTILRKILCAPKKLQISTLDSFFFNIINAFPFECGIAGEITMLPENDDEQRVDALLRLIRSSSDKQRKILLELLKLSSLNTEPYSIFAPTRELIQKSYGEYLKYPEEELWYNTALLDPETDDSDLLTDDDLLHFQNFPGLLQRLHGRLQFITGSRHLLQIPILFIQFHEAIHILNHLRVRYQLPDFPKPDIKCL